MTATNYRFLRDMTADELDALPVGARFVDLDDKDGPRREDYAVSKVGRDSYLCPAWGVRWAGMDFVLWASESEYILEAAVPSDPWRIDQPVEPGTPAARTYGPVGVAVSNAANTLLTALAPLINSDRTTLTDDERAHLDAFRAALALLS